MVIVIFNNQHNVTYTIEILKLISKVCFSFVFCKPPSYLGNMLLKFVPEKFFRRKGKKNSDLFSLGQ